MADGQSFTDTPEFKAAVAQAAAAAAKAARDEVLAELRAVKPAEEGGSGYQAFSESLALAIAALTDQGSGTKHVAPEILRARTMARERMETLILDAYRGGHKAMYRLTSKVHLSHQVIDPLYINPATKATEPTVIEWSGVPNEAMEPINDTAKEIFDAFMDSIGNRSLGGIDMREKRITPSGVVIHSGGGQSFGRELPKDPREQSVHVLHQDLPGRFKQKQVLGSIVAPVMETF